MDIRLFASIFALIFIAELPGKTTFASVLMAARARPWPVLLGTCGAFVVHGAIAVAAGSLVGLLPVRPVQIAVGLIFLSLAFLLWRDNPEAADNQRVRMEMPFGQTSAAAFGVIFLAQWGDPTQLATAALAAKYPAPWTVFFSATLSLWTVAALAVAIGHHSGKAIHPRSLQKIAAAVFAGMGFVVLARAAGLL